MKSVILAFGGLFLFLLVVNKFSPSFILNRTSYEYPQGIIVPSRTILLPWMNFDGKHYLTIATKNYPLYDKLSAFFPLYPLLIRIFSLNLILNPIIVGLSISFMASILAIIFLYKLINEKTDKNLAQKTLFLLLIFPSSFYLFAFYTEGLFLLLAVLTFYFLKRKKLLWASITIALATATKAMGLALIPSLLYEAWQIYKKEKIVSWSILFSPLGFVSYLIFTYFRFNDPFLMIKTQSFQGWDRPIGLLGPFFAFRDGFLRILAGPLASYDNPFVYPVIILEFLVGIYTFLILILSFKKIPTVFWLYSLFSSLLIFAGGQLSANIRYLLVIFPNFLFLGQSLPKRLFILWSLISLALLTFCSALFLRGYWIA